MEILKTNECYYCVYGERIPFNTKVKCNKPASNISVEGYPEKFMVEMKTVLCENFELDENKI